MFKAGPLQCKACDLVLFTCTVLPVLQQYLFTSMILAVTYSYIGCFIDAVFYYLPLLLSHYKRSLKTV